MENKNSFIKLDIFSSEKKLYFLYKKTEKLISAIYLVTDLLSDSEPVKWSLRESGIRSLEDIFAYMLENKFGVQIKSLQANFIRMISLLEIAQVAGLISKMNHKIVSEEFKNLLDALDGFHKEKMYGGGTIFPEGFFKIQADINETEYPIKNNNGSNRTVNSRGVFDERNSIEDNDLADGHISQFNKGHTNSFTSKAEIRLNKTLSQEIKRNVKNARRESIIAVLNSKGDGLTIKDISGVVRGCSEKTIQRELQDMVSLGILKKEGERRWSKYYLLNASKVSKSDGNVALNTSDQIKNN